MSLVRSSMILLLSTAPYQVLSEYSVPAKQPVDCGSASGTAKLFLDYFFNRLVWLATHSHLPSSKTQVSVKRPRWS